MNALDPNNVIISETRRKYVPRMIIEGKLETIRFLTPIIKTPFGIDRNYGKMYLKGLFDNLKDKSYIIFLRNLEKKIYDLLLKKFPDYTLQSYFSGANCISCILDKDVIMEDDSGKTISNYSIEKNSQIQMFLELGDFYMHGGKIHYKWIVKKLCLMR